MAAPAPTAAVAERLFGPALQEAVRDRFLFAAGDPFSPRRIYFENAGGGLTLKTALAADERLGGLPDNAGRDNPSSREVGRAIQAGRDDVSIFLNGAGGTILSEQSSTACAFRILEAAAAGISGSNLVCSSLDHASFFDAAAAVAGRHGLERRVAPLNPATGGLDPEAVLALVDAGTVAVTVIHASNITGSKTDLKAVAAGVRVRAPQAVVLADGAQHAQHGLVDVRDAGVDAYVFSAYKVFSKAGFAFAYLSPRLAALPHAQLAGKPSSDWDLGTRDPAGFAAFTAVVDYLAWLGREAGGEAAGRRVQLAAGMAAIEAHEAALSRRLLEGIEGTPGLLGLPRVALHGSPEPGGAREAVFAFSVTGMPTGQVVRELGRRGVVVHDRVTDAYSGHTLRALGVGEVVRVSLAHYNTASEVGQFLRALKEVLAAA